jgi:transmembrane protein 132
MIPEVPRRGTKHLRSNSNVMNRRSNGSNILSQDIQVHFNPQAADRLSLNSNHLNLTQQHINAALFNSNSPSYSVQPIPQRNPKILSPATASSKNFNGQELHMAEILVESAAHQQRSAFQFDTITPKKNVAKVQPNNNGCDFDDAPLSSAMVDSGIELSCAQSSSSKEPHSNNVDELEMCEGATALPTSETIAEEDGNNKSKTMESTKTETSSSDDNGGFVTPPSENERHSMNLHNVKRATVVGNPMFSSSPEDSEMGPGESLGLDDLDMDYEQIMKYFDNLKVNRR